MRGLYRLVVMVGFWGLVVRFLPATDIMTYSGALTALGLAAAAAGVALFSVRRWLKVAAVFAAAYLVLATYGEPVMSVFGGPAALSSAAWLVLRGKPKARRARL